MSFLSITFSFSFMCDFIICPHIAKKIQIASAISHKATMRGKLGMIRRQENVKIGSNYAIFSDQSDHIIDNRTY